MKTPIDTFISAVVRAEKTFRTPLLKGAASTHDVIKRVAELEAKFERAPKALIDLRQLGFQAREAEIRMKGSVL